MAGEAVSSSLETLVSPGVQVVGPRCGGRGNEPGRGAECSWQLSGGGKNRSHGISWNTMVTDTKQR